MSASIQWYQTIGAAPGIDTPQSTDSGQRNWDFKSTDTAGQAVDGQEITAGDFSMHIYTKLRFTGSFTSVDNVKFYASDINLSGAGVGAYILASGVVTASYAQPTIASRSGTWDPIPEYAASGIDITNADLIAGTPGFTNYVALQLKTTTSGASAGFGGETSFTVVWDEV